MHRDIPDYSQFALIMGQNKMDPFYKKKSKQVQTTIPATRSFQMVNKLKKYVPRYLFIAFEVFYLENLSYLQHISGFTSTGPFWSCSRRLTHRLKTYVSSECEIGSKQDFP